MNDSKTKARITNTIKFKSESDTEKTIFLKELKCFLLKYFARLYYCHWLLLLVNRFILEIIIYDSKSPIYFEYVFLHFDCKF